MTILGGKTAYFAQHLKASQQNVCSSTKEHHLLCTLTLSSTHLSPPLVLLNVVNFLLLSIQLYTQVGSNCRGSHASRTWPSKSLPESSCEQTMTGKPARPTIAGLQSARGWAGRKLFSANANNLPGRFHKRSGNGPEDEDAKVS